MFQAIELSPTGDPMIPANRGSLVLGTGLARASQESFTGMEDPPISVLTTKVRTTTGGWLDQPSRE